MLINNSISHFTLKWEGGMAAGWIGFVTWGWQSTCTIYSLPEFGNVGHRGYTWWFSAALFLRWVFRSLFLLFQWGEGCEYPSPAASFYRYFFFFLFTSPRTKMGEKFVGSVLLFNVLQFPSVSKHQNELVKDAAHSVPCSGYFWKHFPSCFIPLIAVQLWLYKGTSVKWWAARVRCGLCCSHIMEKKCMKIGTWTKKYTRRAAVSGRSLRKLKY